MGIMCHILLYTALVLASVTQVTFGAFGGMVGREQSVGVRGTLLCNGKPESNVLVKLYDDDRGFDFDDFMGETVTDSHGYFELSGYNSEVTPIDPKVNVYHDCNDWWWPCQRKVSVMIPDEFIAVGTVPKKFYDFGRFELAGQYAGETRDCIH